MINIVARAPSMREAGSMRYFFHRTDNGFDRDEEGTECANLHEVHTEAVLYAAGTLRDRPDYVWGAGRLRVDVTDEGGSFILGVVMFSTDQPNDVVRLKSLD